MAALIWTFSLVLAVAICVTFSRIGVRGKKYPPGPSTLPLIGNLHLFPKPQDMHTHFAAWGKQYGGVFSLKVFSHTIVVVSEATAAREIIDKSGWVASARPRNTLAQWCLGDKFFVFSPLGPQQLAARKATETFLSKQSVALDSRTAAESTQLLYELLENPADFARSIQRFTFSTTMMAVYGTRIPSFTAPMVSKYYEEANAAITVLTPGTYPPIDFLPFLKYLPNCLAPWRRHSTELFERRCARLNQWYDGGMWLRAQNGSTGQSGTFIDWAHTAESTLDVGWISSTCGVLIDAGSDTTAAYLLSLVLALASHPHYQHRAWQELDAVVGGDRFPELKDITRVPFVKALIDEILRLHPPFKMALPHATTDDIQFNGYFIPRGATVVFNNYAVTNDPEVFEDPALFKPERFLDSKFGTRPGMDTDFRDNFMFGGGRRICPGQYSVRRLINLVTMRLIWAFEFGEARNAQTNQHIPPNLGKESFNDKLLSLPRPFTCDIKPRHPEIIREKFAVALAANMVVFVMELQNETYGPRAHEYDRCLFTLKSFAE
ncbi:cytochrome P450 [Mycena galopus ATCC 62051]|nr:cytochrome P450 [Mycena galopus ATCC 62051]